MSPYAGKVVAIVDACCLAGALRRNMLLSLAEAAFYQVRWSERILMETARAIERISAGKADPQKQVDAMQRAFPDAMVDGFDVVERTILAGGLKDPGDAHVVAAAVRCGASLIITDNLKDFPGEFLKPYGLQAKSADDFLADCIGLDATQALAAFNKMRLRFKRPEFSWDGLCQKAAAQGLTHTASTMREFSTLFG